MPFQSMVCIVVIIGHYETLLHLDILAFLRKNKETYNGACLPTIKRWRRQTFECLCLGIVNIRRETCVIIQESIFFLREKFCRDIIELIPAIYAIAFAFAFVCIEIGSRIGYDNQFFPTPTVP